MTYIIYFIAAIWVAYTAILLYRAATFRFFQPENLESPRKNENERTVFALLVPVLREQMQIERLARHLSRLNYPKERFRIVFITTEKERAEPHPIHQKSTMEVVDEVAFRINEEMGTDLVRRIHYPYTNGFMAHQVSYGMRYLFEAFDFAIEPEQTFIGVYNADSCPDPDTLLEVEARFHATGNTAFQQQSLYHPEPALNWIAAGMAAAASLWQTRWSMLVERYRGEQAVKRPFPKQDTAENIIGMLAAPFNYAVSHGFFLRLREFVHVNYMPTRYPNEDAAIGYMLPLHGFPLEPLLTLDACECSSSLRTAMNQQAGWIVGPLHSFEYRRTAVETGLLTSDNRICGVIGTLKAFWDAVVWIVGPSILMAAVGMAIATTMQGVDSRAVTCLILVITAYLILPVTIVQMRMRNRREFRNQRSMHKIPLIGIFFLPLFYCVHGIGGISGVVSEIRLLFRGGKRLKYKTERN